MCHYIFLVGSNPTQWVTRISPLTFSTSFEEARCFDDAEYESILAVLNENENNQRFESTPGGDKPKDPPGGG